MSKQTNQYELNVIIRELLNRLGAKRLISIGDSHSRLLSGIEGIQVAHIGPATAFNIDNPHSKNKTREKISSILTKLNKENDGILLSFGEIDIRANIVKNALKQCKSVEESVKRTADIYTEKIANLRSQNWKVLVLGPHASGTPSNPEWPAIGCEEMRNAAIINFNSLVQNFCSTNAIPFSSLAEEAIDPVTLKTNYDTMGDGCHLDVSQRHQSKLLRKLLYGTATYFAGKRF